MLFPKIRILVVAVSCCCLVYCTNNIPKNNGLSTSEQIMQDLKIDDKDYWDHDDYVPYKADRHDSFDWKLFRDILGSEQSNVIVSPFSVKLVLSLLSEAAGIKSNTAEELNSIFPNLKNKFLVHDVYEKYIKSLKEKNEHYTLNLGTKLFFDNIVKPKQRYSAQIKNSYDADVERLDFSKNEEAANNINRWVKNITDDHIQEIVTKDDVQNSVLFIINAIFFEGLWRSPFDNQTFYNPFMKTAKDHIKAEYMTQQDLFYYFQSNKLNAKIIRLPYRGKKFSMTIIMPNTVGAISQLVDELEGDVLKRTQWLMDEVQVKLTVPKFKFDYTSHLKPVLMRLGINAIFTNNASLPGIDRGREVGPQLKVSNIVQKCGLVVHEKGSTAFAATKVEIVNKFGGNNIEEFLVNKPFVFFIEDETTGNILFFGKVMDPTV